MIVLSTQLSQINRYVISTRSRGLDGPLHDIQPGDYVCIKTIVGDPFQKKWKGPYQVLLVTYTAVKIKGVTAWIHYSRTKKAPKHQENPPLEQKWTSKCTGPAKL